MEETVERHRLKDLTWDVSEKEYREYEAYSYSTLARFAREGFDCVHDIYRAEDNMALRFGSLVDCLVTELDNFDSKFYIERIGSVSDAQREVIDILYTRYGKEKREFTALTDEEISDAAKQANYYAGDAYTATRIKKIKECGKLYDEKIAAEGRIVISDNDYIDALKVKDALTLHPTIGKNISQINPFDETEERLFQAKFRTKWEGHKVKCMFDLIRVDHASQMIIPYDLKTTGFNEWDFPKAFLKWKYYIQASLYTWILKDAIKDDPYYKDFQVMPFNFIVVNRKSLTPMTWTDQESVKDIREMEDIEWEDWRELIKLLDEYMHTSCIVPKGMSSRGVNFIQEFIGKKVL